MKKMNLFILLLSFIFFLQCSNDYTSLKVNDPPQNEATILNEEKLAHTTQNFGFNLLRELDKEQGSENIIISPLSISMALGMTLNGANNATFDSMAKTLGYDGLTNDEINLAYKEVIAKLSALDEKVIFEIANSIWYRNNFSVLQPFIDVNQTYFNAQVYKAAFNQETVDLINTWVKEKTHGKIEQILDKIPPDAVMYLINAIYLKAVWKYQFDEEDTKDEQFTKADGSQIDCKMMSIREQWNYYKDEELQAVDMPYGNGDFSMTILLPANDIDINDLVKNLDRQRWETIITHFEADSGTIKLPKFRLRFKSNLNRTLSDLGMGIAFSPGDADFSRINPSDQLFISNVIHKTFIQVDEEGTEAAAVTVVEISNTSVGAPEGFSMNINRPFIFAIREKEKGTIIFIGKIMEPKWE